MSFVHVELAELCRFCQHQIFPVVLVNLSGLFESVFGTTALSSCEFGFKYRPPIQTEVFRVFHQSIHANFFMVLTITPGLIPAQRVYGKAVTLKNDDPPSFSSKPRKGRTLHCWKVFQYRVWECASDSHFSFLRDLILFCKVSDVVCNCPYRTKL